VDVGKDADLVLLDADPLANISATMRIRLVIRGGSIVYER
jgi:imidazolonepropionase-like amidohydrolase